MSLLQEVIKNIVTSITNLAVKKGLKNSAQKQAASFYFSAMMKRQEQNFEPELVVHKAKFFTPLYIAILAGWIGAAAACFYFDILVGGIFFIIFAILTLLGFLADSRFRIEVISPQIKITRLFHGTKFYHESDIISCMVLNNNQVKLTLGIDQISIDPFMVNAAQFANYAQHIAYQNAGKTRTCYKISRMAQEKVIMTIVLVTGCIGFALLKLTIKELSPLVYAGLALCAVFLAFWFYSILSHTLLVDENAETVSFRKFFIRREVPFAQIYQINTKKRFGETAVNYHFFYGDQNKKQKFVISSLDDNSDRLYYKILNIFN